MNRSSLLLALPVVFFFSALCGCAGSAFPLKASDRVVCLGDSITDGCTYPQIIGQALKEAGKPVPTVICSGVASDTAAQMADRLDATVLAYKPTVVTFSAGTNDSSRGVTPEKYEASLRDVIRRVKATNAAMVLLTPCIINPRTDGDAAAQQQAKERAEAAEKVIAEYEKVIRKVAAEEGLPVAENNALMRQAREQGKEVMSGDGIHPNYFGQSLMARSILDAMGYTAVPLPTEFTPRLFPGVVREWKMRLAPAGDDKKPQVLNEKAVLELKPESEGWKTYTLPDPPPDAKPTAEDWWEQERRNGFGCRLEQEIGKGPIQAVAVVESPAARKAFINTGVGISTVWLNGTKIHEQGAKWTGFHAGKERIPVELKQGKNTIAVEINGGQFFLSVTDKMVWEEELRLGAGEWTPR